MTSVAERDTPWEQCTSTLPPPFKAVSMNSKAS